MSPVCFTIVFVTDVSDHTISEYEDGTSRPMFKKRLKTVVTRSKYNKAKQKSVNNLETDPSEIKLPTILGNSRRPFRNALTHLTLKRQPRLQQRVFSFILFGRPSWLFI